MDAMRTICARFPDRTIGNLSTNWRPKLSYMCVCVCNARVLHVTKIIIIIIFVRAGKCC